MRNTIAKYAGINDTEMDLFFAGLIRRARYYEEIEAKAAVTAAPSPYLMKFETDDEIPAENLFFAGLIQRIRYYDAFEKITEKKTFRQTTIASGSFLPVNG